LVAEARHWSTPVRLAPEHAPLLDGDPLAPGDEPRARSARDDLRGEEVERAAHAPRVAARRSAVASARNMPSTMRSTIESKRTRLKRAPLESQSVWPSLPGK